MPINRSVGLTPDLHLATENHYPLIPATALLLTRYDRNGASSRLRTLQYLPYLHEVGLASEISPFFSHEYLEQLYNQKSTAQSVRKAYAGRVKRLLRTGKDVCVLWVEKEALPWLPWQMEHALMSRYIPLVSDYDDALFHRYDMHRSPLVRRMLGTKINQVMAASALVTAGNAYLAARAHVAGARRIEIVPTVVDMTAYTVLSKQDKAAPVRLGWIGTPSTWIEYMAPMMPFLSELARRHDARISAVGAGKAAMADQFLDVFGWSEKTEVSSIQNMDIGLMPLFETPWARGKCGYKLIQYMACGIPVVASPVGVNATIVEHGVNGFLATSEAEWEDALTFLICNPAIRRRMGEAGRLKVEQQYSLQVWGPRVAELLREVVSGSGQA